MSLSRTRKASDPVVSLAENCFSKKGNVNPVEHARESVLSSTEYDGKKYVPCWRLKLVNMLSTSEENVLWGYLSFRGCRHLISPSRCRSLKMVNVSHAGGPSNCIFLLSRIINSSSLIRTRQWSSFDGLINNKPDQLWWCCCCHRWHNVCHKLVLEI